MTAHLIMLCLCLSPGEFGELPHTGAVAEGSVDLTVGYGMSFAGSDDSRLNDIYGAGLFLEGEYIFAVSRWFEPRLYVGAVFTSQKKTSWEEVFSPCDISTQAGFVGTKARVFLPVPKVSPFLEFGIGGSVGSITTRVGTLYDHKRSGVFVHFPFSVGLAIGESRQFVVSFSYLFYPSSDHIDGAMGLGFTLWED